MSLLKKFLVGLVVLIVLLILVALFLPSSAHVERSTTIDAPPHVVFALVDSFANFNRWSPWVERDPDTVYTFEGPGSGVGAKMSWASDNPQVGSGSQQITVSEPNRRVEVLLDFGAQGTAETFYALEPTDAGTAVTWGFDTDFGFNLVSRYMGLMFDSWVGADYKAGLANLKALAERLPSADWTDLQIEVIEMEPMPIAYTSVTTSWDPEEIAATLGRAYGEVGRFIGSYKLQFAGQPLTITTDRTAEEWHALAGVPIGFAPQIDIEPDAPVQLGETPGGRTIKAVSVGPYSEISPNWEKVMAFMAVNGFEQNGSPWEQYVSDPGDTPEAELITDLYLPVQ